MEINNATGILRSLRNPVGGGSGAQNRRRKGRRRCGEGRKGGKRRRKIRKRGRKGMECWEGENAEEEEGEKITEQRGEGK